MQFAFTEEQELLRREARDVLSRNGASAWTRDELRTELSFVDQAVLFEEFGRAGQGETYFDPERPREEQLAALALEAVGIAAKALELAVEYAKQREQFGRPIGSFQAVQWMLADMKTEIDAARLLVWRASWMGRTGKPFTAAEGSMSKLKAGEVAVWATEQAIQILGGYGYVRDYPVEKWHRDSKIYTIFEGTSEIQRLVIARAISGLHIQ